jgi:acyl carrier protein
MERTKFKEAMSAIIKQPVERLKDDAVLTELVNDSFALVDMVIELQDDFDVFLVQDDLKSVNTVGDLIAVFQQKSS